MSNGFKSASERRAEIGAELVAMAKMGTTSERDPWAVGEWAALDISDSGTP